MSEQDRELMGFDVPPEGEYAGGSGGFEFGSFSDPEPMTEMERLLQEKTGAVPGAPSRSDYREGPTERYTDLEALSADIAVKFNPHELLSHNQSQVYMLDTKGAPHFMRPWTTESAIKLTSTRIAHYQLWLAGLVLCVAGLSVAGAFTDRDYVHLQSSGEKITGVVVSEQFNGLSGEKAGKFDHVLILEYGDGKTVEIHDETATPASGASSSIGNKMDLLIDKEDETNFAVVRDLPETPWSPLSLIPLAGVVLFANSWTRTVTINRKLKALSKVASPLAGGTPTP